MALKSGEVIQVGGRLVVQIGVRVEEKGLSDWTKQEVFDLVQGTLGDLLKEFAD